MPARTYSTHTDYYGLLCRLEREKRCLGFISAEAQESSREHMGRAHGSLGPRQPPESVSAHELNIGRRSHGTQRSAQKVL